MARKSWTSCATRSVSSSRPSHRKARCAPPWRRTCGMIRPCGSRWPGSSGSRGWPCPTRTPAARSGAPASGGGRAGRGRGPRAEPVIAVVPTRPIAVLAFAQVPAVLVGADGQGGRLMSRVLDLACVALAAEQAGGARRCLEMSAGYARTRVQFGRPIGTFQAVKHKCADMLVRVELAEATAREAARLADETSTDLPVAPAPPPT